MEDYPQTLAEFEERFASEEACCRYLLALRWPAGLACPRCGGRKTWPTERGLWVCVACAYHASITAGTVLQDTHLPLRTWLRTMWMMTSQKNGISALGLQRVLGLGSYRTAWSLLHKLRGAMVRPGRERLTGVVEVDETYLGGLEEGKAGREPGKKALIVVAAQEDGARIGRIRLRYIPDASSQSLHPFIQESIEPGSKVRTDGWQGYRGVERLGYGHTVHVLRSRKAASELLPRVHLVAALFQRWLLGTHQGAIGHEHLEGYLNEFTFRFNRRTSRHRGKLFYRLVQQAVQVGPRPYNEIVGGNGRPKTHKP